jgi:hypothetical protein
MARCVKSAEEALEESFSVIRGVERSGSNY